MLKAIPKLPGNFSELNFKGLSWKAYSGFKFGGLFRKEVELLI